MSSRAEIEQAIAALEAQRAILGDAVVDTALRGLREQRAAMTPTAASVDAPSATNAPAPTSSDVGGGERRLVTILFADVVGSTSLGEALDAEDLTEILNGAFAVMTRAVADAGGHIARLMGDGMLAFFGAPVSHEDDPLRAVRAAIAIRDGVPEYGAEIARAGGPQLGVRVGLDSGLVVVGQVGSDLFSEYTTMGDAANTAARLQGAAPPNEILLSAATAALVRGTVELADFGPLTLKGKAEPVPAFRVTGRLPEQAADLRGLPGAATAMVGRVAELQVLQSALDEARSTRRARAVTVFGEPGVGKTRLWRAFQQELEEQPAPPLVLRGRSDVQWTGVPFAPLRDLLFRLFEIQDTDPPATARAKLDEGARLKLGPDGARQAPFLGQLVGLDYRADPLVAGILDDARQLHERGVHASAELLRALARARPLVIVFEDIHWADEGSLDLVADWLQACRDMPLLLLCLSRTSLLERRATWLADLPAEQHRRLDLVPLDSPDCLHLVADILHCAPEALPPALAELVLQRSEGNPYFLEELVKMLLERGVLRPPAEGRAPTLDLSGFASAAQGIPLTLTGLLQARLDQLSTRERQSLQRAAVVGRTFWDDAVAQLGQAGPGDAKGAAGRGRTALDEAAEFGLVVARPESAFAGMNEYAFRHALLHEVTYQSLLKRLRRVFHARAARWLIASSGERAVEHAGPIAEHLERAGELAAAADWFERAAEQAKGAYANADAASCYGRCLVLHEAQVGDKPAGAAPEDLQREFRLLVGRAEAFDQLGRRAEQAADLARLQALADTLGDDERCEACLRVADYRWATGDYAGASDAAQTALPLAHRLDDALAEGEAERSLGRAARQTGRYDAAFAHFERASRLFAAVGARQKHTNTLIQLGTLHSELGEFETARRIFEESVVAAQAIGARWEEAWALDNLCIVHASQGDYGRALTLGQEALAVARAIGSSFRESASLANLGQIEVLVGRHERALAYLDAGRALAHAIRNASGEAAALSALGECHLALGDVAQAIADLEAGLELALRHDETYLVVACRHGLALCHLEATDAAQADQALAQAHACIQSAADAGLRAFEIAGRACLALAWLARGDLPQALIESDAAQDGFDTVTEDLAERVLFQRFQVLWSAGRPEARAVLDEAASRVRAKAARIPDPAFRASFLEGVPLNRRILAAVEGQG